MNISSLRRAAFGVGPKAVGRAILRRMSTVMRGSPSSDATPPHPLDAQLQIETEGFWSWRQLRSGCANDAYNAGYLPVDADIGRRILQSIEHPQNYTFFDVGCGKGRALCLATEFGFRRVVGIEINPKIAAIAERNAQQIRMRFPSRVAIEVINGDAATVRLPEGPLVIFLYRPFLLPVLKMFAGIVDRSLAQVPRDILLFYVNPMHSEAFDEIAALERVPSDPGGADAVMTCDVWRTRKAAS